MDAHLETGCEHAMSRTREVAAAELNVWKKALEFSRSSDTAWQFIIVEFERKVWKNDTQVALAKLMDMVSNGVGISMDVSGLEAEALRRRRNRSLYSASLSTVLSD